MMTYEERVIPNYPRYTISNTGVVRSLSTGKEIRQVYNHNGYRCIGLTNDDGRKQVKIHRLVLMTYLPVAGMGNMQVNHKDGNKENNRLDNLEWCTPKENMQHARKHGLKDYDQNGEHNNCHKLTMNDVQFIKRNLDRFTNRELAKMFNVTHSNISCIRRGKTWRSMHRAEGDE